MLYKDRLKQKHRNRINAKMTQYPDGGSYRITIYSYTWSEDDFKDFAKEMKNFGCQTVYWHDDAWAPSSGQNMIVRWGNRIVPPFTTRIANYVKDLYNKVYAIAKSKLE